MFQSRNVLWIFLLLTFHLNACDYYIVFLVNARGLNYSSCESFIHTVAKHPSDWSKNGDVGHAWIYLHGETIIEGGHSGELGIDQPRYLEGVLENCDYGAKNPISYLWCSQADGFFQKGNGGHTPTCAVKVDITQAQYQEICQFMARYDFLDYSITKNQCSSFLSQIAALIDIEIDDRISMPIPKTLFLEGKHQCMWEDPQYQTLTFASPDILQMRLKELVKEGRGKNVLSWYLKIYRRCFLCRMRYLLENIGRFPERYIRYCNLTRT